MERLKSLALTILVCASLVQSYVIAFQSPQYEVINEPEYVGTEMKGTKVDLKDTIYPDQIILHFGEDEHTVLRMEHQFYGMILKDIQDVSFESFRRTGFLYLTNWEDLREDRPGVEVRFHQGVPFSLLKHTFTIRDDTISDDETISRIWIYLKSEQELKVYFLSDSRRNVYEVGQSSLKLDTFSRILGLGEFQPSYLRRNENIYLPLEELKTVQLSVPFTSFTADQLKYSLFVDPSMIRYLQERDGSQIYTDSKRGLQLKNEERWFSYFNPIQAPVESKVSARDNIQAALQFANRHGGWNGTFLFDGYGPQDATVSQIVVFRHYVNGYPVISPDQEGYGAVRLAIQKGVVSNYERSMILLEMEQAKRTPATLPGGEELSKLLLQHPWRADFVRIFPGYEPHIVEDAMELIPKWMAEREDGSYVVLH